MVLVFTGSACSPLFSQLVINEVCSSNTYTKDQFGASPDWIEILNLGENPIELSEYYLSDDIDEPYKWQLPDEEIEAEGIRVFFSYTKNESPYHFNFAVSREGEVLFLSQEDEGIIQTLAKPPLRNEDSFGRVIETGEYLYFDAVSPYFPNEELSYIDYSSNIEITTESGFYTEPLDVYIDSQGLEGELKFTIDGSDPLLSSPEFPGSVMVDSTCVFKAIFIEENKIQSETACATYLLNVDYELPVISLSVESDSLFDEEVGIYMLGPDADEEWPYYGANYWDDKPITVNFEYFVDKESVLNQYVDLTIHGGKSSRNNPQRPFRIKSKGKLGNEFMEYQFFEEKESNKFKHIILRNSGSDFLESNFRDGFWHQMALKQDLDIDVFGFQSVVLLINGEYWGIMNIREKVSEFYLAESYDIDVDSLMIVEKEVYEFYGDTMNFHNFKEFVIHEDLSIPENYNWVQSQLDIESYLDYFGLEIFAGNPDWPANNIKYWKPSESEGKWRYIFFDLDTTMKLFNFIPYDIDLFEWIYGEKAWAVNSQIFINLMENPEFKSRFINRLADLMNYQLNEENLKDNLGEIKDEIQSEIFDHYYKWGRSLDYFEFHAGQIIPEFIDARHHHVRDQIEDHYGMEDQVLVELDVYPQGAGRIRINTIEPPLPFEGIYFNGNPVEIEVIPNEGYQFEHWNWSQGHFEGALNSMNLLNLEEDSRFTAIFEDQLKEDLVVLNNPVNHGTLDLIATVETKGEFTMRIYNIDGSLWQDQYFALEKGTNKIQVNLASMSSGLYLIELSNELESLRGKFVKS